MTNGAHEALRLDDGWLQVKVPLPFSLKWVNAYLIPEGGGWTLIDPGLNTEEARSCWASVLQAHNLAWSDIRRIIVTHHHPDHFGLAGWMQLQSDAEVWMSSPAIEHAEKLWGEGETFSDELTGAFLQQGLPSRLAEDLRFHMKGFREKVTPAPVNVKTLKPGETVEIGGNDYKVLSGDGHAPCHLLFYDLRARKLLCGDQVLPDISPNIGWMPGGDPDPLGSYLGSLHTLRNLDVRMAYPGHRDPFSHFGQRVLELLAHHERRLEKIAELAEEKTAFELCELQFGTRLRENAHQLRFALAETVAHLITLDKNGIVGHREKRDDEGNIVIVYSRK